MKTNTAASHQVGWALFSLMSRPRAELKVEETNSSDFVIRTGNLSRSFGKTPALKSLNLSE